VVGSTLGLSTRLAVLRAVDRLGFEVEQAPPPFGYRLRRKDAFGVDLLRDIRTILGARIGTVLDIGGHIGETAIRYAESFPEADIFSFEPEPGNFAMLSTNVQGFARIHPVNAAVGCTTGTATLRRNAGSQTHSLLDIADGAAGFMSSPAILDPVDRVPVEVLSVDDFTRERGVTHVDLLKADTQGYELEVLRGATSVLAQKKPPLLYLEVSFVPQYRDQPLFHDLYAWLYDRGFRLIAFYERGYSTRFFQVGTNALFIHEAMGARTAGVGRR
jgi:FkbM family methyltransferase